MLLAVVVLVPWFVAILVTVRACKRVSTSPFTSLNAQTRVDTPSCFSCSTPRLGQLRNCFRHFLVRVVGIDRGCVRVVFDVVNFVLGVNAASSVRPVGLINCFRIVIYFTSSTLVNSTATKKLGSLIVHVHSYMERTLATPSVPSTDRVLLSDQCRPCHSMTLRTVPLHGPQTLPAITDQHGRRLASFHSSIWQKVQ